MQCSSNVKRLQGSIEIGKVPFASVAAVRVQVDQLFVPSTLGSDADFSSPLLNVFWNDTFLIYIWYVFDKSSLHQHADCGNMACSSETTFPFFTQPNVTVPLLITGTIDCYNINATQFSIAQLSK